MKRNHPSLCWFRIRNKNLSAILIAILLCAQTGFATTLVVLVSGNAIVFGADGKGVDARVQNSKLSPLATNVFEKTAIFQNRILVSTSGIARIPGIYEFNTWINALPIKENASVADVASTIGKKCAPIFKGEWAYQLSRGNTPVINLSGNKSLPIVSYYVGGNEFSGPTVYSVAIYVDWAKNRLRNPTVELIYPPTKAVTRYKHIFVRHNGADGGGMDQLYETNSDIQRKYLKLYNREVGAALYDEPLYVVGMVSLARIMLTVEIETSPKLFSFPIRVCSSTPNQRPSCKAYDR